MTTKTRKRAKGKRKISRSDNPTDFGRSLYEHIGHSNMMANEFAEKVGLSAGFISAVHTGMKLPPLERVESWANVLKLKGHTRSSFILLAHLEHASPYLRQWFNWQRRHILEACNNGFVSETQATNVLMQTKLRR